MGAPSQAGKLGPDPAARENRADSGRLGGRGPGTPSALKQAARGRRRQEGCCAAAHLREPPARSHPPRAPELGRARPVRRGAVPEAAPGEAALLPDPVQTASPVPGPGTSRAGGGCAGPGERGGAHRRLVIRPGPRAAPAGATREMLAGAGEAWRSCRRGSRRRRARLDCGLGLPQSGSLKGPRPLGLRQRWRRLRPQAGVGGARRPRVGSTSRRQNLKLGVGLGGASFGGGLRGNPGSSHLARPPGAVCGDFPRQVTDLTSGEKCVSPPPQRSVPARHVARTLVNGEFCAACPNAVQMIRLVCLSERGWKDNR